MYVFPRNLSNETRRKANNKQLFGKLSHQSKLGNILIIVVIETPRGEN
jgi:hypothetical protein